MPTASDLYSWLSRLLHGFAWLALAIGLCIGMGWAALHFWIVPRIDDFRPALERLATRTVGMPVQIGALQAESTGWMPSFELREIQLLDTEGRPALTLPRVVVAISVRSVLHLGLEQLVLDRPVLDVRHTAAGQWLVAGLPLGSSGSEHNAAADWLFGQREVLVRGGTLRWTSERAHLSAGRDPQDAPALELGDVDIVLRNRLHQHELRVDATPPTAWGQRFVLMGRFQRGLLSAHPGRLTDWTGQAYAWLPKVDVSQLRQHVRLGSDLLSGQGSVRLWSDIVHGEWTGGTADMDLQAVALRLAPELEPLGFHRLSGRVSGRQTMREWSLATRQLQFETAEGLQWPGGNVSVQYRHAQGQELERVQVQGEQLDLKAVREVALRLPLPKVWHEQLTAYTLAGQVRSLRLQWNGSPHVMTSYQGQIDAQALEIQGERHGAQGISVNGEFNEKGGQLQLRLPDGGWLAWEGVLDQTRLPLQALQSDVRWAIRNKKLASLEWKGQVANEDLQAQSQGQWQPSATAGPGILDLQARMVRINASEVWRYLPLSLPANVRQYVRESVRRGQIRDLQVRVRGDLSKVPMPQARDGEFRFAGQLQDVELAYVPASLLPAGSKPWPSLKGLQGELVFDRQGMRLLNASARWGDGAQAVHALRLGADIPDLTHDARLKVRSDIKGPASQVLRVLQQSPVDQMLSGTLGQASASGALQGKLQLDIPLLHVQHTQVQGSVTLAGNDIQMAPHLPLLGKVQGTLQFSEAGFTLQGVQARLLGGTSRLEGGLRSGSVPAGEPRLLIRAQGQVSAEGLRAARNLPPLDVLARHIRGQTAYSATLGWQGSAPELSVRSNLEGLELNFPAPLGKRAGQSLQLAITSRMLPGFANLPQDQLQVEIGQLVSATYVRDLSGPSPRALRGNLAVGTRTGGTGSLPEQGVSAVVRLDDLPVDAWQTVLPNDDAVTAANEVWRSYLPNRLGLQAGTLTIQGRTLHDVVAGITREGNTWRANLDARELSGHAMYVHPSQKLAGRLFARLTRLNLPPSAVSDVESMMEAPPVSMPALDIQIDELELRGKRLGRVEIEAINPEIPTGTGREWLLQKFNLTVPEAALRATGRWSAANENRLRRTEMNFRLDIQDAGALLSRLGTPGALRSGAGHLEGQIGWNGSPLALHYPSMQGQFQLRMGRGQFLRADPGVAKLLGVLSLQGLPRRLLLDFRDVFYEGFVFDSVQGDVQVRQGVASTRNLQIEGVNAIVKMEGSADLAHETQQLKVLILPQLNAAGASVVAGLAINPVVGLTSYLAQWLLSSPLSRANIQEFAVDGTWSEPRVTRIELPPAKAPSQQP